jgi:hypothetical protein
MNFYSASSILRASPFGLITYKLSYITLAEGSCEKSLEKSHICESYIYTAPIFTKSQARIELIIVFLQPKFQCQVYNLWLILEPYRV